MRCLFTIISALSLMLFIAVVVLWTRSENRGDRVSWVSRGDRHTVRSEAGRLSFCAPPLPPALLPKGLLDPTDCDLANERIDWLMIRGWPNFPDLRPGGFTAVVPRGWGGVPFPSYRARRLFALSDPELLRDLDHTDTFVAAHLILVGEAVFDGTTVVVRGSAISGTGGST
jgi:hypothetical protein